MKNNQGLMLEGKNILITGSSRGIGAETARLAKKYGANVVLHGKSESDALKQIASDLRVEFIVCDVVDPDAVGGQVERVYKKLQRIDALVNCAGAVNPKPFLETTDEDWMFALKTNVLGTFHFCHAVIPHMKEAGSGRIVNIASIRGHVSGVRPGNIPYSASKAAVINMTAGLAKELAPDITVNSVSPGATNTEISKTWNEDFWRRNKDVLMQRIGEPNEIAEMILFLVSDKSAFITGQDFVVDGGYIIGK